MKWSLRLIGVIYLSETLAIEESGNVLGLHDHSNAFHSTLVVDQAILFSNHHLRVVYHLLTIY